MTPVELERNALCDTLAAADPEAPTLCEGWTVADLAAHLVVRERRPDASAGMVVPALRGRLDRLQGEQASRGLPALAGTLRQGPPQWSPFRLPGVDARANLAEFVVHHEDVRRAAGAPPRTDVGELQEAVWRSLKASALLALSGTRVPVVAVRPDGRRQVLRRGDHPVVLTGEPVELLLRVFGRTDGVQVEVGGPSLSVSRFQASQQGV